MSLLKAEMSLRDLAIWLGKYVGVNLTHAARIEEYVVRALAKTAHSSAYTRQPGPRTFSTTEKDS